MKTEHKHAQVLRWIANGIGEEVQVRETSRGLDWEPILDQPDLFMAELIQGESANNWEFRIKPRTVMCNGVEVPAPESVGPPDGTTYYVPNLLNPDIPLVCAWRADNADAYFFASDLVYLSKEDAIARTNAMRRIQPC